MLDHTKNITPTYNANHSDILKILKMLFSNSSKKVLLNRKSH